MEKPSITEQTPIQPEIQPSIQPQYGFSGFSGQTAQQPFAPQQPFTPQQPGMQQPFTPQQPGMTILFNSQICELIISNDIMIDCNWLT